MTQSPELTRTLVVFREIPLHVEFRMDLPLLPKGTELEIRATLRNPKDPRKVRDVDGIYRVADRKLIYTTRQPSRLGLTQYLEMELLTALEKPDMD